MFSREIHDSSNIFSTIRDEYIIRRRSIYYAMSCLVHSRLKEPKFTEYTKWRRDIEWFRMNC